MTPRQQRRLEQKIARKAAKHEQNRACEQAEVFLPASSTPSLSQAKLAANRANAELSSGPVTDSGKQIVSQNAVRHGLTGKFHVLPDESQDDFDELLAGYTRAEAAFGGELDEEEVEMVQQLAEATWLSHRSIRLQDQCLIAIQSGTPEEQKQAKKDLGLYLRYMASHDRAFSRHFSELRRRRSERQRAERGFVSQQRREAADLRREAADVRRQAQENRKKEAFELRQAIANCRRERLEIQNRIAEAKEGGAKTLAAAA